MGDVLVVCDAGGVFVDLISYKIRSIDPLQLDECAVGYGRGSCGSMCVNDLLEKLIRSKVGDQQYSRIREKSKQAMRSDLDQKIQRKFSLDSRPAAVELRGVNDDPEMGIQDEIIELRREELREVFDIVCTKVILLVNEQIYGVKKKGQNVQAVLLVGSFGLNKYLYSQLEASCRRRGRNINVMQSKHACVIANCRNFRR